jgi:hypothetical protein
MRQDAPVGERVKPSGSVMGRYWLAAVGIALGLGGIVLAVKANGPMVWSNTVDVISTAPITSSDSIGPPDDAWAFAASAMEPFVWPLLITGLGFSVAAACVAYQAGRSREARRASAGR